MHLQVHPCLYLIGNPELDHVYLLCFGTEHLGENQPAFRDLNL